MSPSVSVRLLLTQSDARLAQYACSGHERAFEALVHRYRRRLHDYCRRLLLSDERAEDALQQGLLQAWVALSDGAEVRDVRAWLYRIVHNTAINTLRVSGYDYCQLSESLTGAGAPQEDLDRRIAVREALAGLAALPQMQREALLCTAVHGRSHQQVAGDLGVSEPALRGLVYRARATLRAAAGAIVPPPALSWALEAGTRGAPALERAVAIGGGSGSAGLVGLLFKSGALAVTAGAVAGGLVARHNHNAHVRAASPTARPYLSVSAAGASQAGAPAVRPAAFTRPSVRAAAPTIPARRSARRPNLDSHLAQPIRLHLPRRLAPPLNRDQLAPALTSTPDSNGDGRDQLGDRQRSSLGAHDGPGGGARDGHGDGFGGAGPGSPANQQPKDGGGDSQEGSATGPGQDGLGGPASQRSNGEPRSDDGGGGGASDRPGGGSKAAQQPAEPSSTGAGGSGSGSATGSGEPHDDGAGTTWDLSTGR
jgi:RNA polymerase sigma factor (sigma-70 family)